MASKALVLHLDKTVGRVFELRKEQHGKVIEDAKHAKKDILLS